jgi:hypothetical protein
MRLLIPEDSGTLLEAKIINKNSQERWVISRLQINLFANMIKFND